MERRNKSKSISARLQKHNVYRSYSDMMCGLLMLFILVMCICLFQAETNYNTALEEQAARETAQKEYTDAIIAQRDELLAQQETIDTQNEFIADLQSQLASKDISIEELDTALELISSQGQEKIEKILGVKADLIEALTKEFSEKGTDVVIDQETGAMELSSRVLFGYDETELTDEGKTILGEVMPTYCSVLLSPEYVDNVAEIIIDGYTDDTGTYEYNLELSQRRSLAVANYLLGITGEFLSDSDTEVLRSKLTVNGHSMNNLILDENGEVDEEASRRVEVKFRLKDEEMIREIQDMISGSEDALESESEVSGVEN